MDDIIASMLIGIDAYSIDNAETVVASAIYARGYAGGIIPISIITIQVGQPLNPSTLNLQPSKKDLFRFCNTRYHG